jgi:phage baseplate assembly protein W
MAGLFVYQPFKLRDDRGAIAVTDDLDRHLRDKILAVLFTAPGERVNVPRFGVGLDRTVFEPLDELTVAAVEFRLTEGLRRYLGDEAIIDRVDVLTEADAGRLAIAIAYQRRVDRAPRNLEIVL